MATTNSSNNHKGEGNRISRFCVSFLKEMKPKSDARKMIHSIKVGIALVLVSLLYLVNSMFEQVGENAIWAIMTVVVIFEFYAGATLSKGINRGIGTLLGGGLGCLAAIIADEIGGIGNPITVASSVFVFGAAATYCRTIPRMKKKYDYGFMILILTFNLVVVSGVRAEKVVDLARQRLATIGMGFAICIFITLFICPVWASNELHFSTASKFHKLATSIKGCLDEYFNMASEKENEAAGGSDCIQPCKTVLNSKMNEESLANFAKWEPWHGKFGIHYPWEKYLEIGEHLREIAAIILSLKGCIQSPKQPQLIQRQSMKESCESFMSLMGQIMIELGQSIEKMEQCHAKVTINPKLNVMKLELGPLNNFCKKEVIETDENLAITSFIFLLMEIVDKVEILAKKVEELGNLANFRAREIDV